MNRRQRHECYWQTKHLRIEGQRLTIEDAVAAAKEAGMIGEIYVSHYLMTGDSATTKSIFNKVVQL